MTYVGLHRGVRVLEVPLLAAILFALVVIAVSATILSTAGSVGVVDRPATLPTQGRIPSPTPQEAPK